MTHYTNHSVVVQDNADSASVIIGSITQVNVPVDNEILKEQTAGTSFVEQVSVVGQKPKATFNSFDLPKVIDAFGLSGRLLTEGVSKPGLAIYQQKWNNGSAASGSVHRRLRFPMNHTRINRISVSHRQDAQCECECVGLWDGTNAPLLIETSQALPSRPASSGRWTIHSVVVEDVEITCNIQVDLDFGISVDPFGCDSDIWDTHFHINQVAPMVNITSLDQENFASAKVALAGLVGTQANSIIYLRKRTPNKGTFVADATEEHISINFAGIILPIDVHSGSGNQKAQSTFRIEAIWDGTNAPFVFDTTAAIA
jgi:hypothetical protein